MLFCVGVSNALHALNCHITHAHRGYTKHDLLILLHLVGVADHDEQGFDGLYDSLQHHTTLQGHLRQVLFCDAGVSCSRAIVVARLGCSSYLSSI